MTQKQDLENHAVIIIIINLRVTQNCVQVRNPDATSVTFKSSFSHFEKHLKRVHSEVNDYVNKVENDGVG